MTRINCGIPVQVLTNKHLLAEHREITRIPRAIKSRRYSLSGIPDAFTLGAGHVKFFYTKLKYLHDRYNELYDECISRGFNVTNHSSAFENLPTELYNGYVPSKRDVEIVVQRITEKLNTQNHKDCAKFMHFASNL